jgi:FKBP-type peptidyl-prolyl cis-trans isomerase
MTNKTPTTAVKTKLPSPPAIAAIAGSALCLALTIWIFMPYGFLDSLTAPGVVEAPADLIINEQEHDVAADLTPEKNAAFLADNAKKDGVETTKSGLQYRKISGGGGKKPASSRSKVTVHYTGALINGKVFDSSVSRGEPITFGLNQVIPGWTEGLQLMCEGEKAELVIPQDIGYGARGAGGAIPPLQTLVFQVELIKVED